MKTGLTPEVVRRPALAGMFYPVDQAKVRRMVDSFLSEAKVSVTTTPKAVIAPHAGYIYSGPVAGSAFIHLDGGRKTVHRVILLGPSHRVAFDGIALSRADAFSTPLGLVRIDKAATAQISTLPQVRVFEGAHEREHSLEVELPFLQTVLDDFSIVPLVVGEATDEEIREVIDELWGGPETVFVISSDLSHYHDYVAAKKLDRATADAIERSAPEEIESEHACGCKPIRGLLRSAGRRGLRAQAVDLRNSGDTAGTRDEVVGYGAFLFTEASKPSRQGGSIPTRK